MNKILSDRFWSKVENASGADCWQWLGGVDEQGYGQLKIRRDGRGITIRAHRMAWTLRRGPIPEGLCVLHHCDNPGCVNPDHLFLGDVRINNADCVTKGRNSKGEKIYTYGKGYLVAGEKCGKAKLTWADVFLMRFYGLVGMSQRTIAKRFYVSQTAVGYILRGRTWIETPEQQQLFAGYWLALVAHT